MRIIVVGAGIIGTTLAHSLVVEGHQVSLIEAREVAAGATFTNYGWINSHKKNPEAYHAINYEGLRQWTGAIAPRYPELVVLNGHIEVAVDEGHQATLTHRLERLRSLGYEAQWLDPRHARSMTSVLIPDGALVGSFPAEGHAYPADLAATLVAELESGPGFSLLRDEAVAVSGRAVRLASGAEVGGDAVVLCVGAATENLAATAGVRIPLVPDEVGGATFGYLAYADAAGHGLRGLVTTDTLSLRPNGNNGLILQALDLDATANPRETVPEAVRQEFSQRVRRLLPGRPPTVREVRAGQRVIPGDGLTVAGPATIDGEVSSLWIVATHSGVVLAPWLAEVVAAEIGGAAPHRLLADFRTDRFQHTATSRTPYQAPRQPGEQ